MNCFNILANGSAGENLFLNEEFSDVSIIVHDGVQMPWRFPVHSLMLSSQSIVFQRMLQNDFYEKNNRLIEIEDIKPHIIKLLLCYIYRGKVELESWHIALDLLKASHKYQIEPLVQNCGRFLESILTIGNVCYIYKEAHAYAVKPLKEKCLDLILDAGFVILRSKGFEMLNEEAVLDVITNSNLNIDSELMVFEALLRWAPMQCCRLGTPVTESNILNALEPFMKYVCFDDMSDTDKSALPAAVLSCVKPNNRNRIEYCIPDTLLSFANSIYFNIDFDNIASICDNMSCILFSVDTSLYMIGLKFIITTREFPNCFPLSIIFLRESVDSNCMHILNIGNVLCKEVYQSNDNKFYVAQVKFPQPCVIDSKSVYKLKAVKGPRNSQCPRTVLNQKAVSSENGLVNISLHSENVWGILEFLFI